MSNSLIAPPLYHKSGRIAKKAISKIQETLNPEEKLIASGDAFHKHPGAWVVTNKRLLFAYKNLFSSQVIEIPRDKITGIEIISNPLLDKVKITYGSQSLTLDHLKPKPANKLASSLNS